MLVDDARYSGYPVALILQLDLERQQQAVASGSDGHSLSNHAWALEDGTRDHAHPRAERGKVLMMQLLISVVGVVAVSLLWDGQFVGLWLHGKFLCIHDAAPEQKSSELNKHSFGNLEMHDG